MPEMDDILKHKPTPFQPGQGKLLVSEPFLKDYFFRRSVVLLAEHNEDGSFGVIINKPIEYAFNEVVAGFPQIDIPVFLGGPVQTDRLFYIHTLGEEKVPGSLEIMKGLWWGGDIEQVRKLMSGGLVQESNFRFFVGYSGWEPEQLDRELQEESWVIAKKPARVVMSVRTSDLWTRIVRSLGKDYVPWTRFPIDPSLN